MRPTSFLIFLTSYLPLLKIRGGHVFPIPQNVLKLLKVTGTRPTKEQIDKSPIYGVNFDGGPDGSFSGDIGNVVFFKHDGETIVWKDHEGNELHKHCSYYDCAKSKYTFPKAVIIHTFGRYDDRDVPKRFLARDVKGLDGYVLIDRKDRTIGFNEL